MPKRTTARIMINDHGDDDGDDEEDDSFVAPLLSRYPANATLDMFPRSREIRDRKRSKPGFCIRSRICPESFRKNKSMCFMLILASAVTSLVALSLFYNEISFRDISKHLVIPRLINVNHARSINNTTSPGHQDAFEFQTTVPVHSVSFDDVVHKGQRFNIYSRDVIVFLHIQKTGGSTFERHLVSDIDLEEPCICDAAGKLRKGRNKKKRVRIRPPKRLSCTCPRPSSPTVSMALTGRAENNELANNPSSSSTWLFSRFNIGWKCGVHADWTELTECVDPYLDSKEGVENRRYFYTTFLRDPIKR